MNRARVCVLACFLVSLERRQKVFLYSGPPLLFVLSPPRVPTGRPREPQGNPFHPPSPPRTPLLPETYYKSSLNKISRLGTGSILALYVSALCISFPLFNLRSLHTLSNPSSYITHSLQATRTTGVWTAICLSSMPISSFDRYPFSYSYVAYSLPLADVRLPFPPLSIRLQVHCPFSASDALLPFSPLSIRLQVRCPFSASL